jgi:hypothetical protein
MTSRRNYLKLMIALPALNALSGCGGSSSGDDVFDARTNSAAVRALILVSLLAIETVESDAVVINSFRFFFSIIDVFLPDGTPTTTAALKPKQAVKISVVPNVSPERYRIQILSS